MPSEHQPPTPKKPDLLIQKICSSAESPTNNVLKPDFLKDTPSPESPILEIRAVRAWPHLESSQKAEGLGSRVFWSHLACPCSHVECLLSFTNWPSRNGRETKKCPIACRWPCCVAQGQGWTQLNCRCTSASKWVWVASQ